MTSVSPNYVQEFLASNPNASRREVFAHLDGLAKRFTQQEKFAEARAAMNQWADHLQASRQGAFADLGRAPSASAARTVGATLPTEARLPAGISAGKLTAITAGVAVLAAGAYGLYRMHQSASAHASNTWVDRVSASRSQDKQALSR